MWTPRQPRTVNTEYGEAGIIIDDTGRRTWPGYCPF
jgi:hypothetical protein